MLSKERHQTATGPERSKGKLGLQLGAFVVKEKRALDQGLGGSDKAVFKEGSDSLDVRREILVVRKRVWASYICVAFV